MGSLSGFRPPQFSEDDAWLPLWVQQCDVRQLNVEGIGKDYVTFEKRVEELQSLQKHTSNGQSFREESEFNIGQLFLSGTDSSPFSFAPSDDNVVQFHLCLSSDGSLENTIVTADANQTALSWPLVIQPLRRSAIFGQKDANLSSFQNAGALYWSPTVELEKSVEKNELLRCDENMDFCEAAADAVELCVVASEALAINEVMDSDSSAKPASASDILETSLQLKQARLEVWKNIFSSSIDETSETDNLSDLDDLTMGSAYEDAGIYLNESQGNELSISQVNDTFDSEYGENIKHEGARASAMAYDKSYDDRYTHRMEGVIDNDIQSRKDLAIECFDGKQKKAASNPDSDVGSDVGYHCDWLRTVDDQAKLHLSISPGKGNLIKSHETNMSSSPIMSCQDKEKYYSVRNTVQERFQSRWLGGWSSNNETKYFTAVKNSIPEPFAGETSLLSESADAAPDENSVVLHHDKGTIIASQLSIPSENLSTRAKDGMLPSQDVVRSSNTSLADPLCSVVPCSISENVSLSPATNNDDTVCRRHLSITVEHKEDIVLGASPSNNTQAERERITLPIATIKESADEVSRQFTSLRNYSKIMPRHATCFRRNSLQKKSFLIGDNAEMTFWEAPFTNCKETVKDVAELPVLQQGNSSILPLLEKGRTQRHSCSFDGSMHNLAEENISLTALPENKLKCLPSLNQQQVPLQCNKVQTVSQIGYSNRAAKRLTRSNAYLESRAQKIDRFLKGPLNKEKKRLTFQNMEFLLTGFSQQKEKEIEGLIRKYGGVVLSQIPFTNFKGKRSSKFKSRVLPIVLCLKKFVVINSLDTVLRSTKTKIITQEELLIFPIKSPGLQKVNAFVLKVNWLIDSIAAGFVLPPTRYMILFRNISQKHNQVYTAVNYNTHCLVFNNLGVMLHEKSRCHTNIATIIEHGGGQVFKTLRRLIQALEAGRVSTGVVVSDEDSYASRHLKQCALEQNIQMTSVYWIIKCLYAGHLIPFAERRNPWCLPPIKIQRCHESMELSQEI